MPRLRESVKLDADIETFEVWHKETGEKLVVDWRTFDEEIHSKKAPKGAKADPEPEPEPEAEPEPEKEEKPKKRSRKS